MFQRWREIKIKKKLIRNKTERSKVRTELWNYFQPIHKHLGHENHSTSEEISQYIIKKCNIKISNEYEEEYFKHNLICYKIFALLMSPKSKYYIKGLVCEVVIEKNKKGIRTGTGHYYIIKTIEEQKRIDQLNMKSIKARDNKRAIRLIETTEFLKQIDFKDSLKQIINNSLN